MLKLKQPKAKMTSKKSAVVAKTSKKQTPKRALSTKTKKTALSNAMTSIVSRSTLSTAFNNTSRNMVLKLSKRKFSADAVDPESAYDEVQAQHAAFTPEQKDEYNAWLFAKLSPILKQSFYASLAISRLAPSQPDMPDDEFITTDLLETLTAHNLLIPKDSKVPIPENAYDEGQGNEVLDDLMHVLTNFNIIPADTLSKFKKGYINPKIEFDDDQSTNPFDKQLEVEQTQEDYDQYGPIYTVGDALDNCLKMAGFYDVVFFQKDETDAQIQLPPKPDTESAKTSFKGKRVELFPFHEEPNNPFVQEADQFFAEYLQETNDPDQLLDYHDQFFRYDVSTTLHEEVQEIYDRVMGQFEDREAGSANIKIEGDDLNIFKGLIRDFYLQTSLYQNYLSDPDPKFPFFNINMDFTAQMQQIDAEAGADDHADEQFVNDGPSSGKKH